MSSASRAAASASRVGHLQGDVMQAAGALV